MTWDAFIEEEMTKPYFKELMHFIETAYQENTVYPSKAQMFKAFELTPLSNVRVVILGQDPYHQPNQAMGLSFSVPQGTPLPKSLINIYKELDHDLGINKITGDLTQWAKQGVFLLNTILTVEKGKPLSHQHRGWETFTHQAVERLNQQKRSIVFVLWGKQAEAYVPYIAKHHKCIISPHPSPLSAYRGFFGSKPFSQINQHLIDRNEEPIDWSL